MAQTPTSPLEAARQLAPLIRASANEIEANRELPRALFEAIADAGLFHLAVPRALGGTEVDYPTYVQVLEEIGKADASTAWIVNQCATFGTYAARMAPAVARAIWIDTPRSIVANTPAPNAQATVVPGGYRVTGRQGFSTGCRHASWISAHATVVENGTPRLKDGKPEARYFIMPIADVELLDTWHVRGMRGTGTHHFAAKDIFVPEERSVFLAAAPLANAGPRYKIGIQLAFAGGDAAIALGMARSCLAEFYELAGAKTPRFQNLLRDQAMIQLTVGQTEAALRSGRAFLMEAVNELWNEALALPVISLERRMALRVATTHAIRLAAQAIDAIYNAAGATAVFEGNLIQRHFQDIHVITQHLHGRLAHYEFAGQHWLGLPVDETKL
ncbi:MAG TPA: acyl-CoA dehydrogenase family protein [Burkholderiales bacterium]|nr:acyl-CoA dehydrogenase family protein [Burkholderiales bacterium]